MTKDEALKLALESLEHEAKIGNDDAYRKERDAIKQALEQPPYQTYSSGVHVDPVTGDVGIGTPKQPEPEPVCVECGDKLMSDFTQVCYACVHKPEPVAYQDTAEKSRLETVPAKGTLLHTIPPKREPLTE